MCHSHCWRLELVPHIHALCAGAIALRWARCLPGHPAGHAWLRLKVCFKTDASDALHPVQHLPAPPTPHFPPHRGPHNIHGTLQRHVHRSSVNEKPPPSCATKNGLERLVEGNPPKAYLAVRPKCPRRSWAASVASLCKLTLSGAKSLQPFATPCAGRLPFCKLKAGQLSRPLGPRGGSPSWSQTRARQA